ncbi:hypothetical protein [Saccharopolyspora sp. CA-218241]|uniref:hypothetical protein n=1 Tax=Saccharopolyspora sp. CA-218241 TaxID=3240027 RepID=UPI003D987915
MTQGTERTVRWKSIAGHVIAWPLLTIGAVAAVTLYSIAMQGYGDSAAERGIAITFFLGYVVPSALGTLILVTITGWRSWSARVVVAAEALLLVGAIAALALGPR